MSINRDLAKTQTLGLQTWAGAWDSALLRTLLVMLMRLVYREHFEEEGLRGRASWEAEQPSTPSWHVYF